MEWIFQRNRIAAIQRMVLTVSLLADYFPQGYDTAAMIDASLTSCIATSFFFNGLVDLKIISERNTFTLYVFNITSLTAAIYLSLINIHGRLLMVFSYAGIFYAYFARVISAM